MGKDLQKQALTGAPAELTVEDFLLRTQDLGNVADVEHIARLGSHKHR